MLHMQTKLWAKQDQVRSGQLFELPFTLFRAIYNNKRFSVLKDKCLFIGPLIFHLCDSFNHFNKLGFTPTTAKKF